MSTNSDKTYTSELLATLEEIRQVPPSIINGFTGYKSYFNAARFCVEWQEWVIANSATAGNNQKVGLSWKLNPLKGWTREKGKAETWQESYRQFVTYYSLGNERQVEDFKEGSNLFSNKPLFHGNPLNPISGTIFPTSSKSETFDIVLPQIEGRNNIVRNVPPWALSYPYNYTHRKTPPKMGEEVWFQVSTDGDGKTNPPLRGVIQAIGEKENHWKSWKYYVKVGDEIYKTYAFVMFDHCPSQMTDNNGITMWV